MRQDNRSNIEQQVMASVAVIFAARKLVSFEALVSYAFILSVFGISLVVSVPHILANFSSVARGGFPSVVTFLGSAVGGTTLLVQLALLVALFALGSLFLSFVRGITGRRVLFA